jgi:hypothetical protein
MTRKVLDGLAILSLTYKRVIEQAIGPEVEERGRREGESA